MAITAAEVIGYDEQREFSAVDPRGELTAIRLHYADGSTGRWHSPNCAGLTPNRDAICTGQCLPPTTNPTSKEHQS